MINVSHTKNTSKKWWHLWSCTPCCIEKNSDNSSEIELDKSQVTREKIILAAFNEMYQSGFQAASLIRILKDSGITKGALYHHFENKIELG